jgi:hypothetical protein
VSIFRQLLIMFLGLTAAAHAQRAQTAQPDPFFSQVPFDQWRANAKQSLTHWSADLVPPELSAFQRIATGVKIQVDGPELPKHHALILAEFEDADGAVWQTHAVLGRGPEFLQNAFVLPGDYSVSVAIYDPVTRKHGFTQKKLHVAPLKTEPLPGAWEGLPRVEFFSAERDSVGWQDDAWYLPSITNRLRLPLETRHRVHINVLVNTTPSESVSDSLGELRRNMSAVIPAMKTLSQIDLTNGSMDFALLDLTRQRSINAATWDETRAFFAGTNPGVIDVHALDSRWKMRSFFADQLTGETAHELAHVVIILSGPAFFPDWEPGTKIDLPSDPLHRVFYIRCRLIPHSVLEPRPRPRPGVRPRLPRPGFFRLPLDDLEKPLESSGAMLFDVITPEQFRRVLAAVIGQISRM